MSKDNDSLDFNEHKQSDKAEFVILSNYSESSRDKIKMFIT